MPVTESCRGELIARHDGAGVAEALLGVQRARQLDARIGLGDQLLQRLLLDDDREGRRRDDVGVAERARSLGVGVLRIVAKTARANSRTFSRPTR